MDLTPSITALIARLDALRGAVGETAMTRARVPTPFSRGYKVGGKLFAIVGLRAPGFVILKCDPHLIEVLKDNYKGVGHRSHLDHRHWIAVDLDADVPADEIARLIDASYDLVRATLTKKQQAELAAP